MSADLKRESEVLINKPLKSKWLQLIYFSFNSTIILWNWQSNVGAILWYNVGFINPTRSHSDLYRQQNGSWGKSVVDDVADWDSWYGIGKKTLRFIACSILVSCEFWTLRMLGFILYDLDSSWICS